MYREAKQKGENEEEIGALFRGFGTFTFKLVVKEKDDFFLYSFRFLLHTPETGQDKKKKEEKYNPLNRCSLKVVYKRRLPRKMGSLISVWLYRKSKGTVCTAHAEDLVFFNLKLNLANLSNHRLHHTTMV